MVNLELQKHEVMFLSPTIFFKSSPNIGPGLEHKNVQQNIF